MDTARGTIDQAKGGEDGVIEEQHGERAEEMLEPDRQPLLANKRDGEIESKERPPAGNRQERVTNCGIAKGSTG